MRGSLSSRSLSIIVPLLNERKNLTVLARHLDEIGAEQLILVDGGSEDGTQQWLETHWVNGEHQRWLLHSSPGRAQQMNVGAQKAQGDMLLFLHADTQLPPMAKKEICQARDQNYFWGRFDLRFTPTNRINRTMRLIALLINIRSRLSSIATGDQAMFVDREVFFNVGGFPAQPLMEDVELCKQLKQHGVPFCSDLQVQTSARRWQQQGVIKTVLLMWFIRAAYFFGMPAHRLARIYRHAR